MTRRKKAFVQLLAMIIFPLIWIVMLFQLAAINPFMMFFGGFCYGFPIVIGSMTWVLKRIDEISTSD